MVRGGGGKRDRKGEETVGEPNKVQSVVMGSQDLSWGKSESKTKRWKSWRGGEKTINRGPVNMAFYGAEVVFKRSMTGRRVCVL